ncbi:GNAT family N-acetyltransferase [Spirillospora sp. NPDC127200]
MSIHGARPPEKIVLAGLLLRRFTEDDLAALHRAKTESFEHLHPWMPWAAQPPTPAEDADFLAHSRRTWDEGSEFGYGMFDPDGGAVLGAAGLMDRQGPGSLEIGYWVHPARTRRGLATAAAAALTGTAFGLPGVARTEIRCDEANTASAAVPERLGYRLDRVEDREAEAPAETGRGMVWIMTRREWADRRAAAGTATSPGTGTR